jgi:hypothetical protein
MLDGSATIFRSLEGTMNRPPRFPHCQLRPWRLLPLLALLLLSALLALGASGSVRAQDEDGELMRSQERAAPEREPTVLSRQPLAPGAVQVVVALPAVADTYIASQRPNENFGNDALFLGYNLTDGTFGAQRTLLRFDVESYIPQNSLVNEARLQLRLLFSSPSPDSPMPTSLRPLASPWDEHSVTWNTEPAWSPVEANASVGSALAWYELDVTNLAGNWVNQVVPNYGLIIIGDETLQQRERAFYSRETTTGLYPRLVVDYTVSGDDQPPIVTVDALPAYSRRTFTVSWSGDDPGGAGIAHYDVQYRVDGGSWITWQEVTTDTSAEFTGDDGHFYEFRARGLDNVGNLEDFGGPEASTTVDTRLPTAVVNPLPPVTNTPIFTVSWTGDDHGGSGIAHYDVQYRINGGPWVLWQQQTVGTSAQFTAAVDGLYEFEARAVDNVGHVETFRGIPEASLLVDVTPPFVEPRLYLPLIVKEGGS